jgi:signal transduction histidine kinase
MGAHGRTQPAGRGCREICAFRASGFVGCATILVVIRAELALGILGSALWIYCLFDVIMADESRIRNLPKVTWIFIVLVTSVIGAVAWLVAGRPQGPVRSLPYKGNTGAPYPEYERPGRFVATNPDDDAEFLRQVRERAAAQTAEAKRQRLERERLEAQERERRRLKATEGEPDQVDPA